MKLSQLSVIACLFFFNACASYSTYQALEDPVEEEAVEEALTIPAGVDSLTAAESDELAQASFVSYEEEQESERLKRLANAYRAESDTIWYYLSLEEDDSHEIEVAGEDDVDFINAYNEGADRYIEMNEISDDANIGEAELQRQLEDLMNKSINAFEEALKLNPFDSQTRYLLGELYTVKAIRLVDEQQHKKAIDVLEKLARMEKGDYVIYSSLADNYFSVNNYELAVQNYDLAISTLKSTAQLTDYYDEIGAITPEDSNRVFLFSYYKGLAHIELFDAGSALDALAFARNFTTAENELQAIQSEVDFIRWDDGNIIGSMRRDSIITLANRGEYLAAESGYMDLKQILTRSTAIDEIDWRLAVVQYQHGVTEDDLHYKEKAVDRLMHLFQRTETDGEGNPVDPDYKRYFDDYGTMTYNLGIEYDNANNRRMTFKYLNQSSKVNWNNRARSNLRIAELLSNNIQESIRYAELAEREVENLSNEDRRALYELLTNLHRRNGNMEIARNYRDMWNQL